MANNRNPKFDAYIAEASPFAQPILRHLRALVHEACPEATEEIKWSNPCFGYHGKILCMMPAFKAHLAFGFWHRDMQKFVAADLDAKKKDGLGALGRIEKLADLPSDAKLRGYIKRAMELTDSGTAARAKPKAKPEAKVP